MKSLRKTFQNLKQNIECKRFQPPVLYFDAEWESRYMCLCKLCMDAMISKHRHPLWMIDLFREVDKQRYFKSKSKSKSKR